MESNFAAKFHIGTDYAIGQNVKNLYKKLDESDKQHNDRKGCWKVEKRLLFLLRYSAKETIFCGPFCFNFDLRRALLFINRFRTRRRVSLFCIFTSEKNVIWWSNLHRKNFQLQNQNRRNIFMHTRLLQLKTRHYENWRKEEGHRQSHSVLYTGIQKQKFRLHQGLWAGLGRFNIWR